MDQRLPSIWLSPWTLHFNSLRGGMALKLRESERPGQTRMPQFMLEGPQSCNKLLFCANTICIYQVTETILSASSSDNKKQPLCFVHGAGPKKRTKT